MAKTMTNRTAKKSARKMAKKATRKTAKKAAKKTGPKDRSYVNKKQKYETAYESRRKTPAKKFGAKKTAKRKAR